MCHPILYPSLGNLTTLHYPTNYLIVSRLNCSYPNLELQICLQFYLSFLTLGEIPMASVLVLVLVLQFHFQRHLWSKSKSKDIFRLDSGSLHILVTLFQEKLLEVGCSIIQCLLIFCGLMFNLFGSTVMIQMNM